MADTAIQTTRQNTIERRTTFAPTTISEAFQFAEMLLESGMIPKSYVGKPPAAIVVALQFGMEVGLAPLQALQNIANINGQPSLWGDAALGLVRASGLLESIQEDDFDVIKANKKATCIVKRHGDPIPKKITFTYEDAQTAGIFTNAVWKTYPYRMCMMRARAFALRDKFGDVLKGLSIAEEVQDATDSEAVSLPSKATTEQAPTITQDQAMQFFKAWRDIGKHTKEEALAYLSDICFTADSRKMHPDQFAAAMEWASTPNKTDVAPAVASASKDLIILNLADPIHAKLDQLFGIHEASDKEKQGLLKQYEGKYPALVAELEANLPQD